jgi:hypothetical protein
LVEKPASAPPPVFVSISRSRMPELGSPVDFHFPLFFKFACLSRAVLVSTERVVKRPIWGLVLRQGRSEFPWPDIQANTVSPLLRCFPGVFTNPWGERT